MCATPEVYTFHPKLSARCSKRMRCQGVRMTRFGTMVFLRDFADPAPDAQIPVLPASRPRRSHRRCSRRRPFSSRGTWTPPSRCVARCFESNRSTSMRCICSGNQAQASEVRRGREIVGGCDQEQSGFSGRACPRGNALLGLGRPADALASFERALAINPELIEAYVDRAAALQFLGRHAMRLPAMTRH